MPSEVAVAPGVIVIVQLLDAASVMPQVVEFVVPVGQVGGVTAKLTAVLLPVLVMVITRASPEEGVLLTPNSLCPLTLKAN